MIDIVREVHEAEDRIRALIRETPIEWSPLFSVMTGAEVVLKCDNLQHTGSFKVRGALNKVLSLTPEERANGVITASTGNHGAAVAYALARVGAKGIVCVPHGASATKVAAIERLGADIRYHGSDGADTEVFARRYAEENDLTYVSPYNDPKVIGGQGTLAVELARQTDPLDALFVALGGGGLISGVARYLKSAWPHVRVVGCSPANSQVMIQSVNAGKLLDLPSEPTLSDGTAGGVEANSITFPLVRDLVDEFVTVSETEIAEALRLFMDAHHMMIEGAAGVAIAAMIKSANSWRGRRIGVVLCGANIALETLREALADSGGRTG